MTARPLIDAEYDRVSYVLNQFRNEHAMNLENLDGFFAALICGPSPVDPSEYLPEIWGGEMDDEEAFSSEVQLKDFLDLIMRHWDTVAATLQSGDVFLPLPLEDDHGIAHANDWAQGFMRGMELRREAGSSSWMTKTMVAGLYRSWHWRMSTTPIRPCAQSSEMDHRPTAAPSPKSGVMIRAPAGQGRNTSGAVANPHCTDEDRHSVSNRSQTRVYSSAPGIGS